LNVAAYARYSTDKQTENSIAAQLDAIIKFCQAKEHTISATYIDEAQTGTNTDREGFRNLLQGARNGLFDCVVVYDVSRGSRDVADWFTFRKEMMQLGISILSATEELGDISKPDEFLRELLSVGLGQHMVLQTRQKSMAGVAQRAKSGVFLGGVPPLGYDVEEGRYVVNDREAKVVRKIFVMYADGNSYNQILDALVGIYGKRGRPLGKNSLHSVLTNERYIGVYTWNKRFVKKFSRWAGGGANPDCVRLEAAIPQIIDDETWERVQKRMTDNKRNASNKARRVYLLSGLIECTKCGAAYVAHTSRNQKGYEYTKYVCGNKYRTHTCDAAPISANVIEPFVIENLKAYLLEVDFAQRAGELADIINNHTQDLSAEREEVKEIEKKLANGTRAILSGLDYDELRTEMDNLRVRKSELLDIIHIGAREIPTVDPVRLVALFRDSVENFDEEHLPEIIRRHITKIYAHDDGSFTVNAGVHMIGCGEGI